MAERTFGWVQEAYTIGHLKRVVSIFVPDSQVNRELRTDKIPRLISAENGRDIFMKELEENPMEISYAHLKGKGVPPGGSRAASPCSGIVQAALPGQSREYQSDWPADSFLRWAISIGFLAYDRKKDTCSLTKEGESYATVAPGSEEEEDLLTKALLSNPPVCRILSLLSDCGAMTKFELGSKLGFIGEAGFTSIPQYMILEGLKEACTSEERAKLLQDTEGTSDKYVRTICSWLKQMGWVSQVEKEVSEKVGSRKFTDTISQSYQLTLKGRKILKHAKGVSKFSRVPKRVPWEMLATKTADRDYLRNRRTHMIQYLSGGYRSAAEILNYLSAQGFSESREAVEDDLQGLSNIGLNVKEMKKEGESAYQIMDDLVGAGIPEEKKAPLGKSAVGLVKAKLQTKLKHVDHKYLALLDLGFDGKANRLYEIQTAELLTSELSFGGRRLGDTRKPDICIYYGTRGLILDNKAYSKGYSLPIKQADEMYRYLEENRTRDRALNPNQWWKVFDDEVTKFRFAFVSGSFGGHFEDRLDNLWKRSGICGAAVTSETLLLLAEEVKAGRLGYEECIGLFEGQTEVAAPVSEKEV